MLNEYLENGKLSYLKNIYKDEQISKDILKVDYYNETVYFLCTFNGLIVTDVVIVSGGVFFWPPFYFNIWCIIEYFLF